MLRCPKTSESRTPPRAHILLRAAICDEHWVAGDDVQRFHDASPNGARVYHVICGVVTRKKCGEGRVWPARISDLRVLSVPFGAREARRSARDTQPASCRSSV